MKGSERGNMYMVFIPKKEIIFSYAVRSKWSYGYGERKLNTAKEVFSCEENDFCAEEKSIEEIYEMIAEGFAFFSISERTRASDIQNYIEKGFKIAFIRAGEFRKFRKDYADFS